ncbi:uncharacterized protein [Anabrus simplex]|uniref:uncharacterized protein n=1 Tax=Anabrus simplex TaxID=316456 RepID=UPI0035A28245
MEDVIGYKPPVFDYEIQDAVVTELNGGKEVVVPSFEGRSEDSAMKQSDGDKAQEVPSLLEKESPAVMPVESEHSTPQSVSPESDKAAPSNDVTSLSASPDKMEIPLGRSMNSPTITEVVNERNSAMEYVKKEKSVGDTSQELLQKPRMEGTTPAFRQALIAPGLLGQTAPSTQGYFQLYYPTQYQYRPPYYSPSNDLLVKDPYSNSQHLITPPTTHGSLGWTLPYYFPTLVHNPMPYLVDTRSQLVEYGPRSEVFETNKVEPMEGTYIGKSRMAKTLFLSDDGKGGGLKMTGDTRVELINEPIEGREGDMKTKGEEDKDDDKDMPTEVVMETGLKGESRGPFITRLLVRKGGVAIAGPGGIATAGSGGTAIVGPGGVAYAKPNGLSIVGPGGKVVSLPAGLTEPRSGEELPPGARVLAVGPTVYYHPPE